MASRRSKGFVENVWTCPNCDGENKGSVKTCENCGAPQPDDVQFHLPSEQKLVKDEAKIKAAAAGADIHCGFCGTRNPGDAVTCSQCGGDLSEGQARESGRVMQAPPPPLKVIKCDNCETENPGTNSVCSNCGAALPKPQAAQPVMAKTSSAVGQSVKKKPTNWKLIGGILGFLAVCGVVMYFLFGRTVSTVGATVTSVYWETSVPVQELRDVDYSNETGSPPSNAYNVTSYTEEQCETKYIDQGNGFSEEVEECTYTDYYSYTVDEWTTIDTVTRQGNNLQPIYADPTISSNQQLGEKTVIYEITFLTEDGDSKIYSPSKLEDFQKFDIGSSWILGLNTLEGITSVEQK